MIKKTLFSFFALLLTLTMYSCSDLNFHLPPGPKGGDGKSVYEIWKEQVELGKVKWPKDRVSMADFLIYIKGEKGDKGENGKSAYELWKELIAKGNTPNPHNPSEMWPSERNTEADFWDFITGRDGNTPYVGENGNWWIGGKDTGVLARGRNGIDGKNGLSAYELWKQEVLEGRIDWPKDKVEMSHFFQYLKGKDGKDGKDGVTPHIGPNGNWWFGDKDTGVPAKGKDGKDGVAGVTPHIGENGNWWIGDKDTGVPAKGKDGKDGQDGQDGKDGQDGQDGTTPHIGENGNWWIGDKDTGIPAKGKDGKDGQDGVIPHIGENGNWWIGDKDTGVPAKGKDGKDGVSPHIGENGNWWIGDKDTGIPAKGKDGKDGQDGQDGTTPHIGENGNWWIGDKDTGVPAKGKDGKDGKDGVSPHIGENGNWWIGDKDTGIPAKGEKGKNGADGLSAYQLWVKDVKAGKITDPETGTLWPADKITLTDFWKFLRGAKGDKGDDGNKGNDGLSAYEIWKQMVLKDQIKDPNNPTQNWPKTKVDENHFWEFLTGKNGVEGLSAYDLWKKELEERFDGANPLMNYRTGKKWPKDKNSMDDFFEFLRGKDGKDGDDGAIIELGKPNVLPVFYNGALKEYVNPKDGSVLFDVLDKEGKKVGQGVKVKGLPGLDADKTFVTDANGQIKLLRTDLPDEQPLSQRKGSAKVEIGGAFVDTAANTIVPNRVKTRITMEFVYLRQENESAWDRGRINNLSVLLYKYERKVDGNWVDYPKTYPAPDTESVRVKDHTRPVDETNITSDPRWGKANIESYSAPYNQKTGSRHLFFRPVVLTPTEETLVGKDLSKPEYNHITGFVKSQIAMNRGIRWDGTDRYMSIRGKENFYGEEPIMSAAIHVPEIYPVPSVSSDNLNRHVAAGSTRLWGKLKLDAMPPFYLKYEQNGNVWIAVKKNASELHESITFGVGMKKALDGSGGSTYIKIKPQKTSTGGNFVLADAYVNNPLGGFCHIKDIKGQITLGAPDDRIEKDYFVPYRDGVFYKLVETGDPQVIVDGIPVKPTKLVNIIDPTISIVISNRPVPSNWMILASEE